MVTACNLVLSRVMQDSYSSLRPVWTTYIVNNASVWAMNKQTKLMIRKLNLTYTNGSLWMPIYSKSAKENNAHYLKQSTKQETVFDH